MKTYTVSEPFIPDPIWVSPSGSDETGDGTETNPFRQIQKAVNICPAANARTINVAAGEYDNITINLYKVIRIQLFGNITINNDTNDRNIFVYHHSRLAIQSGNENTYQLNLNHHDGNTIIVDASYDSSIQFYSSITHQINNNSVNDKNIIYNCGTNAYIMIDCDVKYQGKNEISSFFNVTSGSRLYVGNRLTTTSIGNLVGDYFCYSGAASHAFINLQNLTIGSNYSRGLYAWGAFISANIAGNNANVPLTQGAGGRIFLGNSTSTTNSISPGYDILELGYNDVIEMQNENERSPI